MLKTTFGIANFAKVWLLDKNLSLEELGQKIVSLLSQQNLAKGLTFKLEAKRSDKTYPLKSPEIAKILGEIVAKSTNLKPKFKSPDLTIWIEVENDAFLVYFDKTGGLGGLPVGTSGKGLVLLSGGIDSPVAAWLMMKR